MSMLKSSSKKSAIAAILSLCIFTLSSRGETELLGEWRLDALVDGQIQETTGSNTWAKIVPEDRLDQIILSEADLDPFKQALTFPGTRLAWLSLPVQGLSPTDSFAIELWVKLSDLSRQNVILANVSGLVLQYNEKDKTLSFMVNDGSQWATATVKCTSAPDEWLHLLAERTESSIQLFAEFPGEYVSSTPVATKHPASIDWPKTVLGLNGFDRTSPLSGQIAKIKIYRGALGEEAFLKSKP